MNRQCATSIPHFDGAFNTKEDVSCCSSRRRRSNVAIWISASSRRARRWAVERRTLKTILDLFLMKFSVCPCWRSSFKCAHLPITFVLNENETLLFHRCPSCPLPTKIYDENGLQLSRSQQSNRIKRNATQLTVKGKQKSIGTTNPTNRCKMKQDITLIHFVKWCESPTLFLRLITFHSLSAISFAAAWIATCHPIFASLSL